MAVLDQGELERSPLADLHAIAAELGVEGFRRLRREQLVSAIVDHAGGGGGSADAEGETPSEDAGRRPRTGAGRGRGRRPAEAETPAEEPKGDEKPARRRGSRGGRAKEGAAQPSPAPDKETEAEPSPEEAGEQSTEPVTGVLDILPNGSGFLRGRSLAPAKGDVHVAPAQIRRCELRPGDEVAGPMRGPRRSERHPSLVHVETVNGAPAEPPAQRGEFEELAPAYATEPLPAPDELAATPFGKGSRVAIVDPPGAEGGALLRCVVAKLREGESSLPLVVALAGARPEDAAAWRQGEVGVVGGSAEGSVDEQTQAAELALARAKRLVESGADVALVVDSLDAMAPDAARRIFASARRAEGGGSLTVIGTLFADGALARLATTRIVLEPRTGALSDDAVTVSPASATVRADLLSG